MKEKLKELSMGRVAFGPPQVVLSETGLTLSVLAGEKASGEFTVTNSDNTGIRGVIYSDSRRFYLKDTLFTGISNTIAYEFTAEDLAPGTVIRGSLTIVSDCGEVLLPYTATVELPYCMTRTGRIKDLFHFANLAKSDWMEAARLFKSEAFEKILLKQDGKNLLIYQTLIKSVSTSQAMEEFLVAVHKKLKIHFSLERSAFSLEAGTEAIMEKLVLTKDTWGYAEIKVYSDASFLIPDHKIIWTDNFIGNRYTLEFVVEPSKMRPGRNLGTILLKTVHQTLSVTVEARKEKRESGEHRELRKRQECETGLIRSYLDFRMNRIHARQYAARMESVLKRLSELDAMEGRKPDTELGDLIKIHLCIADGHREQAKILLNRIEALEPEENGRVEEYAAWLYLRALFTREKKDIEEACEKITGFYHQGYRDWKMLWYLLYLDKKYTSNRRQKLEDLEAHLRQGLNSPVLYLEAAAVYNEEPMLLHSLNEVSVRVAGWAVKEDYFSKEAALQFTYLSSHLREFHPLVFSTLVRLYARAKSKEVLAAICSLLIKGQKTGEKYLPWYWKGVEGQLRVTQLNEYYMYSTPDDSRLSLPAPLIHYFVFNSTLGDKKKACLYASVINNKKEDPSAYGVYKKHIDRFALKQLREGAISESLAVIYEDFISKETLDEETALLLPDVMFRYELCVKNPSITGVYVSHKELSEEQYVPLVDGRAIIDLFTDNAQLFLADGQDNRYVCTIDYTLNKLLHLDEYAADCYRLSCRDIRLLLYLAEQNENYQKSDENEVYIKRELLACENVRDCCKGKWSVSLVRYFYNSFNGDDLEAMLNILKLEEITPDERPELIEYMIIRDLHKTALFWMKRYGYERIDVKRLLRLWTGVIAGQGLEERDEFLVSLGFYIFRSGKYNETLLKYLVRHYNGTTKEMYRLWKAADGFLMETGELSERLLAQVLFTEGGGTGFPVFFSYYKRGSDRKLIRAFLNYNAYKYLVNDRIVPPELFDIIKKEIQLEENETQMLALLKHYSTRTLLGEEEAGLSERLVDRFLYKGMVLPFFKDLKGKISIPFSVSNKVYVEYRTDPSHLVTLHYCLDQGEGEGDFQAVPMENVFGGIFVRGFVLFYHEALQYYITEEGPDGESITESRSIAPGNQPEEEENKYTLLNLMLMTGEMGDEKTLSALMETFIKTEYALDTLFHTL